MKNTLLSTISLFVWVSVLTISIVAVNARWINPPRRIVTVDIISLVKEKIVQTANSTSGKKSKEYRESLVKKINLDLEWALKKIADQNDVIIVPKQAVLAGQTADVTNVVRRALGLTRKNTRIKFTFSER
ncbi:hypothetical protein MNBD_GAMMA12-3104 [hydrothermal vent metagenome]|uniref:Uncharacterized protein n=1 Tax=hydrothermal vent metagenome TaxID=652676 RepID=A0A3B0YU93_9ZZZZ